MLLLVRVILRNESRNDLDEQMFYCHFTKVNVQTVEKHDRHYYGRISKCACYDNYHFSFQGKTENGSTAVTLDRCKIKTIWQHSELCYLADYVNCRLS